MKYLQCRPCTADPTWHVRKINDDQGMGVDLRALQADALSSPPGGNVGIVYPHVDLTAVVVNKLARLSCSAIEIVNISACWIIVLLVMLARS